MKTSIALIVAETRRTVGWLARGAAAQVRRVLSGPEFTHRIGKPAGSILSDLRDRQHDAASSKSAALATAEASRHFIRQN